MNRVTRIDWATLGEHKGNLPNGIRRLVYVDINAFF
jgi:hypothetical protein